MEDVIDNGFDVFNGKKKAKIKGDNVIPSGYESMMGGERKVKNMGDDMMRKSSKQFGKNCMECGSPKGSNYMCVTCMSHM